MTQLSAQAGQIRSAIQRIRTEVAVAAKAGGHDPSRVKLLAATKYVDVAGVRTLHDAGVDILGENRVASLKEKVAAVPDACWHFIGRMQSRQVRDVAPLVSCIQTLCSASSSRQLGGLEGTHSVFLQVNTASDPAKDGLQVSELDSFLAELPDNIQVDGLMTMPAFTEDPEGSRSAFAQLRQIQIRLQQEWAGRHPVLELSMGTSQDYAVAVEEGSTIVRLGRVLFEAGEL